MAKQVVTTVPFEASELAEMQGLCKGLVAAEVSGIAAWQRLTVLLHPNGTVRDTQRSAQASKVYQAEYADLWSANYTAMAQAKHTASGSKEEFTPPVITDDMRIAAKDYGRKHFSRSIIKAEIDLAYRDPPKAVEKGAQTASNATQDDAAAKQGTTVPADSANAIPHIVAVQQLAKDLQVRQSSINAALLQFQTSVRIPAAGKPLIGDIAEQVNKLGEQVSALIAALV